MRIFTQKIQPDISCFNLFILKYLVIYWVSQRFMI